MLTPKPAPRPEPPSLGTTPSFTPGPLQAHAPAACSRRAARERKPALREQAGPPSAGASARAGPRSREGGAAWPAWPASVPLHPTPQTLLQVRGLVPSFSWTPPPKSANSLTSLWVTCALQHFPQEGPENRVESATCCLCLWVPCPAREGPGADSSLSVHPATGRPWVPHHVLLPSASTMEACPSPSDALTRCVSINGRWAGRLWKSLVLGRQGCRSAHLRMRPPAPPEEMKLLQCQAHTKVNAALAVTPPHSPRPVQDAQ